MPYRDAAYQSLSEERPTLWPHSAPERDLPQPIVRRLAEAMDAVAARKPHLAVGGAGAAVAEARSCNVPGVLARTLYQAAAVCRLSGAVDRCHEYALEARVRLEQVDDRWRSTRMMMMCGENYLDIGELAKGRAITEQAADRFRLMGDPVQVAVCMSQMARADAESEDFEAAVGLLAQAASTEIRSQHPVLDLALRHDEAKVRAAHAALLTAVGDSAGAAREHAMAAATLPHADDLDLFGQQIDRASALNIIARVAIALGDRATVARALSRLIAPHRPKEQAQAAERRVNRGSAWLLLALANASRADPGRAIRCGRRAERDLRGAGVEALWLEVQQVLADLLERAGAFEGAFHACQEVARLQSGNVQASVARRAAVLALDLSSSQRFREPELTLAYAQRLSNVGHMVASVNHELNQPMASIRMASETALALIESGERGEAQECLVQIRRLGDRLTDLTAQLAAFPVRSGATVQSISLRQAVADSLTLLHSRLVQVPCEIAIDLDDVQVLAHEDRLVRAIANVVNNALDVMEAGRGRLHFSCSMADVNVVLSVRDNGPGLTPGVLARLFEPFFTTKPAGRGLGLGLAMSRDVMREMGGDLAGHNDAEGRGACFKLTVRRSTIGLEQGFLS